jgi:hypothetical protein
MPIDRTKHDTLWAVEHTHRGDPAPARDAALRHVGSGRAITHAALALSSVRDYPGRSAAWYGHETGLGHHEAQRRLSDLARRGLVERGEPMVCSIKMVKMSSWWPST